jgi:hypothetical protein
MAMTSADLQQFTGSEQNIRHSMNRHLVFTEGVDYVRKNAGAFWLIDDIAIANAHESQLKNEEFQSWTLVKHANNVASLMATDGNNNILYAKKIDYTDFPLDEIKFYVVSTEDFGVGNKMLMLPSEY